MVITHAGHLCYVPPAHAYEHGGYEIESAVRRGLARDAQSRLCDSVCRQVFGGGD
jgi:hypothetical protein